MVGEYLVDGEYRRFELRRESDGKVWSHSEALNLDLWWVDGELRFWDSVMERWLLSHEEERARAEAEAFRADRAEAELRRLRERLAELGDVE